MVDLIKPSEKLIDPIEVMELGLVERLKLDLCDSTHTKLREHYHAVPAIQKGFSCFLCLFPVESSPMRSRHSTHSFLGST